MNTKRKPWTVSDEKRKELEKVLDVLLKDHIDFINGDKDRKEYPTFG